MRDQVDRNYGLTGGWLYSIIYGDALYWCEWSAR